jgi:hypothetical protein
MTTETAVVPQDTRAIKLGAGEVVAIIPQTFEEVYRPRSRTSPSSTGARACGGI